MRTLLGVLAVPALLAFAPFSASLAQGSLTRADSALVGRILLAEDRRDSTDAALRDGAAHADARVQALAARANGRIRDARFGWRDSSLTRSGSGVAQLPAPVSWPEAPWRLRYRGLTAKRDDCSALEAAVADSSWPVRLRAADVARGSCAANDSLVHTFTRWVDALPAKTPGRARGAVSWHGAAHGLVALARLRPTDARPRMTKAASHVQWEVRTYAARAAAVLADTSLLRTLARDANGNVMEAAIDALFKITGHADDAIYLAALNASGAQAVRSAAIALKGSANPEARTAANATFERWARHAIASERDVRVALLEAAGRPVSDDRSPAVRVELPPMAVALALGTDVRLRVTMSDASGGGLFVVRLRGDAAPMMSARILALATSGYYNNGNWHRVEHDFVIQGGGPGTNEYVGFKDYLRDELATIPHARGTVGMSTRAHDTGDAQWFINLRDNLRLGRDYTVFGEVVEGMDVVDGILEGDVIARVEVVR